MKLNLSILIMSSATLLAACGNHNSNSGAQDGSTSASSVVQSQTLDDSDMAMIAQADENQMSAGQISSSSNEAAVSSLTQGLVANLGSYALASDDPSCLTLTRSAGGSSSSLSAAYSCAHARGTQTLATASTTNGSIFAFNTSELVTTLALNSGSDVITLSRDVQESNGFLRNTALTYKVNDSYLIGGSELDVAGSVSVSIAFFGGLTTVQGNYSIVKNSGAAETVTVSSSNDLHYGSTCRFDAGSVTYTSSSGLVKSIQFSSCSSISVLQPNI